MKYLLDSDTLIRASNDAFSFETAPGFWSWLERLNKQDIVFSIDKVKQELEEQDDQLRNWARMRGSAFFLKTDCSETVQALRKITAWLHTHNRYSQAAKQTFLSGADYRLVGQALAMGATVVTFEKDEPAAIERIKIPSACKAFGVASCDLWKLRKTFPSKLVLE